MNEDEKIEVGLSIYQKKVSSLVKARAAEAIRRIMMTDLKNKEQAILKQELDNRIANVNNKFNNLNLKKINDESYQTEDKIVINKKKKHKHKHKQKKSYESEESEEDEEQSVFEMAAEITKNNLYEKITRNDYIDCVKSFFPNKFI
jgi:hypothetical protein